MSKSGKSATLATTFFLFFQSPVASIIDYDRKINNKKKVVARVADFPDFDI